MSNEIKTIYDIMEASDKRNDAEKNYYFIPLYQRGYRWTIDQAKKLIDDIYNNYKRYYDKLDDKRVNLNGYEYCIQPLVLKLQEKDNSDEWNKYNVYNVIDGQQRLTTLSIIFCALNNLDNSNDNSKKDQISIGYERSSISNTKLIISSFCDKIHKIVINNKDESLNIPSITEFPDIDKINKIAESISDEAGSMTIDEQFMLNVYLYCYLFFKTVINEKTNENSYFAFRGAEFRSTGDYSGDRLNCLRRMFKDHTTVIWYEPEQIEEQKVFEKFNSRKIELTKSELVKALFMNPDNYIKEECKDYTAEAIKTYQIMLGTVWDNIEKQLHNTDFWHFFPHHDEWHNATHFDALIDFFVYKKTCERSEDLVKDKYQINFENPRFSFDQLENWIISELSEQKSSEGKTNIMKKWWNEICGIFDWYSEIYDSYTINSRQSFEKYHRISLLQMITELHSDKIDRKGPRQSYFKQLDINIEIINKISNAEKNQIKNYLNNMIEKQIDNIWRSKQTKVFSAYAKNTDESMQIDKNRCDTLDKKIRALTYDSNNILIIIFLVIDSLSILEKTGGTSSRFCFYDFSDKADDKQWIREHIFARGTNFSENRWSEDKAVKFLKNLTTHKCGWEAYISYRFDDLLTEDEIEILKQVKQTYLKAIDGVIKENNTEILTKNISLILKKSDYDRDADCGYILSYPNEPIEAAAIEFLKDNSMGNMSMLTKSDNSSVSNGSYQEKKKKIINTINSGSFVPVSTLNVFNGTYCDDYDIDYWYPCHRIKYLDNLIKHINSYLGKEELK